LNLSIIPSLWSGRTGKRKTGRFIITDNHTVWANYERRIVMTKKNYTRDELDERRDLAWLKRVLKFLLREPLVRANGVVIHENGFPVRTCEGLPE